MGAYICKICDNVFDSYEVLCYEYEDELICERCQEEKEIKEEGEDDE